MRWSVKSLLWLQPLLHYVCALTVDPTSQSSLTSASKITIEGMLSYYGGQQPGQTPGIFNQIQGYYWWMAGAAWNAIMQYWWLTGDASYNDLITQAMLFQVGANNDYMPANQTHSEGNDDQCFWGLAAVAAAEMNFPNPPSSQPQWLALAQAVFNEQWERWDSQNCGGGLRWQIFPFNSGYDYKNSISNGCMMHLGARLARYTGNQSYVEYADQIYTWMETVGLLTQDISVYDGTTIGSTTPGCQSFDQIEWTYNNGQLLSGSAFLYNFTNGNATWKGRLDSLIGAAQTKFFVNGVIWEPACETNFNCDVDQFCFKGFLAQYMGLTTQLASYTSATLNPLLQTSATAAANYCNQGTNDTQCTMWWTGTAGPATLGVGQQMSALNVFNANMMKFTTTTPTTAGNGGTSVGNPDAGNSNSNQLTPYLSTPSNTYSGFLDTDCRITPATTGDKALAGILTAISCVGGFGFAAWLAI